MKKLILAMLAAATAALWTTQALAVSVSYTLSSGATTSAGVYDSNGILIRTLWSNVHRDAGTHTADWNGLDDDGILRPNGSYEIRVLSGNVHYTWEGVVGNTSDSLTTTTFHRSLSPITGMAITDSTIYFATGYNEQLTAAHKASKANPQQRTPIGDKGANIAFVATDGSNVYWAGSDPQTAVVGENSFVFVTATSDDAELNPSASTPITVTYTNHTYRAINALSGTGSTITGLAVQKNGPYLFVARRALNRIDVVNKTTGALVTTHTQITPTAMATDSSDHLWVAKNNGTQVTKFTVNPDGTLTANSTISTFGKALALAVSPDDETLLMADGSSNQWIVAYEINGTDVWTIGQQFGYALNPDVTNDKFYFRYPLSTRPDPDWSYLAFDPSDGSFWVGDIGNYRSQHYQSNAQFIDRIQYIPAFYSANVDQNDRTRLFANFMEFSIDYSKPLAGNNGSWTLVKNWGWNVGTNYTDPMAILRSVATLSNGRTYALLRNGSAGKMEVVELPTTGAPLRFLGVQTSDLRYNMDKDGNLRHVSVCAENTPYTWSARTITFNGASDPTWGPLTAVVSSPPKTPDDPCITGNTWSLHAWELTSSGTVLAFAEYPTGGRWHIQGLDVSSGQWKWKSAYSTNPKYRGPYPNDGSFDVGNGMGVNHAYAGGGQQAVGHHVFWEYHGEFWKQGQTNKITHLYDNGLQVGEFGVASNITRIHPPPTPGMASNAFAISVTTAADGSLYLYQNDESQYGGVHRWHITGLDSINEDTFSVALANPLQAGLQGTYYDTAQLSNLEIVSQRIDSTVNFAWSTGAPTGTGLSHADNFGVRWRGFIQPLYTEQYTFYVNSSDGIRLWVNNQPVIEQWEDQAVTESSGTIKLEAGKLYPITLEYYDWSDDATVTLSWSSATQAKQIVPSSQLSFVETFTGSGTNLLEGLQHEAGLNDGLYGWHRTPSSDLPAGQGTEWAVRTNIFGYRRDKPADVSVEFNRPAQATTTTAYVARDLLPASAGASTSWSLDGTIAFEGLPSSAQSIQNNSTGGYLDILDDANKVIARISTWGGSPWMTQYSVIGNGQALMTPITDYYQWSDAWISQLMPFRIFADGGQIKFTIKGLPVVTTNVFDGTSNWQKPRKLQMTFWNHRATYGRTIGLGELTFTSTP